MFLSLSNCRFSSTRVCSPAAHESARVDTSTVLKSAAYWQPRPSDGPHCRLCFSLALLAERGMIFRRRLVPMSRTVAKSTTVCRFRAKIIADIRTHRQVSSRFRLHMNTPRWTYRCGDGYQCQCRRRELTFLSYYDVIANPEKALTGFSGFTTTS